jgi:hypothetical protein
MRLLSIGVLAILAWAAPQTSELPAWVINLARIKRHLKANFQRMPNYVCLQTIHRFQSTRRNPEFRPLDVLRLEVAVVGGHELFAREGAHRFTEDDPVVFISQGSIGTGAFSTTASNLFVYDAGRTTGFQEERDGGKPVFRYDYDIPQMLSPMKMSWGSVSAWVGERGSYWIEPETLDLLEIEDNATDIAPELGIMDSSTTIKYGRMRIGEADVLLPVTAEMTMSRYDGTRSRNVTGFSSCRAYTTESTITFGPSFVSDSKVTYGGETRSGPPPAPKK